MMKILKSHKSIVSCFIAFAIIVFSVVFIKSSMIFASETTDELEVSQISNDLTQKSVINTTPAAITVPADSEPAGVVKLEACNKKDKDDSKKLTPRYILYNTGKAAINLEEVKIRYYYTVDGDSAQEYKIVWQGSGNKNITGKFAKLEKPFDKADCYFETSFLNEAGLLQPGESIEIHNEIKNIDKSEFIQTNDYSYIESKDYTVWDKVTVLVGGELVWGDNILFGKPDGIIAVPYENSVNLAWNQLEGATSYDVECNNQIAGTVTDTFFEHSGLCAGTIYNYRIRGKSSILTGDWSGTIPALTLSAPPQVIDSTASEEEIIINWDPTVGADSYDIEADGQLIENINNQYIHSNLNSGTQHSYRIRANNLSGSGNWSEIFNVWTLPPVITGVQTFATQDVIAVLWNETQGAEYYEIEFDNQIYRCNIFSFSMLNLLPGTEHQFRIRAANDSGAGQWNDITSYWTIPDIVKTISAEATTSEIVIAWGNVTGATAYDIEVDGQVITDQSSPFTHLELEPGSRHLYRIRAKNSSGLGFWNDCTEVWTIPDKVENVVLHPKETEVIVEWDHVTGAAGYDLEADGRIIESIQQPYIDEGLLPGTSHTYKVRAKNSSGEGEWSEIIQTITIPGPVQNISNYADEFNIVLDWLPVMGADSYDIEADGILSENVTAPFVHKSLDSGTEHIYRIRACNSSGLGKWSDGLIIWTLPGIPGNIKMEATDSEITIQWDDVTGAMTYDIEIDGVIMPDVKGPFINSGLSSGTEYSYRIRARNSSGAGQWSDKISKWTRPGIVSGMDFKATQHEITLSWEAETGAMEYDISVDGAVIEGVQRPYTFSNFDAGTEHRFMVRGVNSSGEGNWNEECVIWTLPDIPNNIKAAGTAESITLAWDSTTGATNYEVEILSTPVSTGGADTYTHYGLSPNTQYIYRVRAANSSGNGEWSDIIAQTTLTGTPVIGNVNASDNNIELVWNSVSGATGYDINIDGEIFPGLTENKFNHTGLKSNSSHTYMIRSRREDATGDWSNEIHVVTLMAAPCNLAAECSTDNIEVSWDEIPDSTGYDIEVDGEITDNGYLRTYTHYGLKPDSGHTYRVRARNGNSAGMWSEYIYKNTLFSAPENISIIAESNTVNISWDMLSRASGYDIELDGVVLDNGLSSTYKYDGLEPLTEHKIRVRARNRDGTGAWSEYQSVLTLVGTPSEMSAVSKDKQIEISWEPVQGAADYELMVDGVQVYAGTQNSFIHSGLEPNTTYFYKVRARNYGVIGNWSEAYTFRTLLGTPANLNVLPKSNDITISWDEVAGAGSYDIDADGVIFGDIQSLYFVNKNLLPETEHKYRVRAKNGSNEGEWSGFIISNTTIGVPGDIKVQASTNSIALSWDMVNKAVGYDLEVDGKLVLDIKTTYYTHGDLEPNTRHIYRIRTKGIKSVSEWSSIVTKNTIPEITIPLKKDSTFNFVIVAPPGKGTDDRTVIVNYSQEELEVFDLCAVTPEPETILGEISGTNITIVEFSPGKIVYKITGADKTSVNIIKFISKAGGYSKVTYIII